MHHPKKLATLFGRLDFQWVNMILFFFVKNAHMFRMMGHPTKKTHVASFFLRKSAGSVALHQLISLCLLSLYNLWWLLAQHPGALTIYGHGDVFGGVQSCRNTRCNMNVNGKPPNVFHDGISVQKLLAKLGRNLLVQTFPPTKTQIFKP